MCRRFLEPSGRGFPGWRWLVCFWVAGGVPIAEATAKEPPEAAIELESYVVTGTRTKQSFEVAPVQVQVISGSEIDRLGGRSFADAMEYVPGVQVESNCQTCNTTDIRLLGLDGNYNQILFGGLPMLSSLAGVYGVEQVPAGFIDRIEVVKGGGSSLYGANAVAGVINVIPRNPRESGVTADYRFDTVKGHPNHFAEWIADHVSADRDFGASVYGQLSRVHPVDLNGDSYTELARRSMELGGVRGRARVFGLEWTGDLNYTHEYRRGGNRLDQPAHLANISEELETRRAAATFSVASRPGGDFEFRAVVGAAFTNRDSYYGGLGDLITETTDPAFDPAAFDEAFAVSYIQYGRTGNPLYLADLQFDHRFSGRTVSWGIQSEFEKIDDRNVDASGAATGTPPLVDEFTAIGLFVQDEWTPRDDLTLLTGLRIDKNNKLDEPVVSPRFSMRYAPSRTLVIRSSVATGFRSPRIFDEDLHIDTLGAEPVRIINAPDLDRESALTGNVGLVWNPPAYADRLAFEVGVFAARISDAFQLSENRTEPDGRLYQERFNTGGLRVIGAEFNAAWSFSPKLRADLGFVLQQARLNDPEVIFDDGFGWVIATDRLGKSPEQLGVLRLQHEDPEGIDWALGVRYIGPMYVLNNTAGDFRRTPAFVVFDVSIGRHLDIAGSEWELRVGVQNLTDARQMDLESGALRDSDFVYGPRQPRTLSAQLKWRH